MATTYQLESQYETSITSEVSATDTSISVSSTPLTVTSGFILIGDDDNRDNWELSYFDGVSGSTLTFSSINQRGLAKNATSTTDSSSSNRKDHVAGTKIRIVDFHTYFNDKASLTGDNAHSSGKTTFTSTVAAQFQFQSVTTAQRGSLTGVTNGTVVLDSDDGVLYQYLGGAWSTFATGTTVNASTTVAGKVEEATVAEQGTGSATGGSGARLFVACANLVKTSSGVGDENKIPVLDSDGKFADGFQNISEANATTLTDGSDADSLHTHGSIKFGGDDSDGAIDGSSDVTITGSNNTYIVKDYTSWAAAQGGGKTLSITPTGCILHIKISGDADFTDWTIDVSEKGMSGGAGGAGGTNSDSASQTGGASGSSGNKSTLTWNTGAPGGGGGGGASGASGSNDGAGGGGGAGGCSHGFATGNAGNAASGGNQPGAAGSAGTNAFYRTALTAFQAERFYNLLVGQGGAGGGGGSGKNKATGTPGAGGAGGAGGGCIIIEVNGDLTFSSTSATVAGANGTAGSAASIAGGGGGGGGGGAGGMFILLYNGSLTGSLTPTVSGGSAGSGGAGADGGRTGGAGGSGKNGLYIVEKNISF